MSKKLFALEDISEVEDIVIAPESEDEFKTTNSELEAAGSEVEELQDQAAHATEVASTLEAVGDSLGHMDPDAPIPEPVMESLNLAISGLLGSIGMSQRQRTTAMESFTKATTAKMAMGSIKETATKIWEKIKAFFVKIKDAIVAMYKKVMGLPAKVKAFGKSLQAQSKNVSKDSNKITFKFGEEILNHFGIMNYQQNGNIYDGIYDAILDLNKSLDQFNSIKFGVVDSIGIKNVDPENEQAVSEAIVKVEATVDELFNDILKLHGAKRIGENEIYIDILGQKFIRIKRSSTSIHSSIERRTAHKATSTHESECFTSQQINTLGKLMEELGEKLHKADMNAARAESELTLSQIFGKTGLDTQFAKDFVTCSMLFGSLLEFRASLLNGVFYICDDAVGAINHIVKDSMRKTNATVPAAK